MQWVPISSSDLAAVAYDAVALALKTRFHSGGVYTYSGVPATVYQGLLSAPSKGRYFHRHIKDRYPFRRG